MSSTISNFKPERLLSPGHLFKNFKISEHNYTRYQERGFQARLNAQKPYFASPQPEAAQILIENSSNSSKQSQRQVPRYERVSHEKPVKAQPRQNF
jgi:hypothetical protein